MQTVSIVEIVLDYRELRVILKLSFSEPILRDDTAWMRSSPIPPTDGRIMIDSGIRDITGRLRVLLLESPIADIRNVRVQQDGDRVLLAGQVRTYYAKQMAQETIRGAVRGLHIVNDVKVD